MEVEKNTTYKVCDDYEQNKYMSLKELFFKFQKPIDLSKDKKDWNVLSLEEKTYIQRCIMILCIMIHDVDKFCSSYLSCSYMLASDDSHAYLELTVPMLNMYKELFESVIETCTGNKLGKLHY